MQKREIVSKVILKLNQNKRGRSIIENPDMVKNIIDEMKSKKSTAYRYLIESYRALREWLMKEKNINKPDVPSIINQCLMKDLEF